MNHKSQFTKRERKMINNFFNNNKKVVILYTAECKHNKLSENSV